MTPEEAHKVICPEMSNWIQTPNSVAGIPTLMLCYCKADECAFWLWNENAIEYVEMDNRIPNIEYSKLKGANWLTHTNKPPPKPKGEGWEPMHQPVQKSGWAAGMMFQTWHRLRKNRRGRCGLISTNKREE